MDFDRAIELGDYAEAYYNRGDAKSKLGDYYGAEADRKRAIELNPARARFLKPFLGG